MLNNLNLKFVVGLTFSAKVFLINFLLVALHSQGYVECIFMTRVWMHIHDESLNAYSWREFECIIMTIVWMHIHDDSLNAYSWR